MSKLTIMRQSPFVQPGLSHLLKLTEFDFFLIVFVFGLFIVFSLGLLERFWSFVTFNLCWSRRRKSHFSLESQKLTNVNKCENVAFRYSLLC